MKQSIIVVPAFHGKILIGLFHRDFTKKKYISAKKIQNMFTLRTYMKKMLILVF